MTHGSLFSGIGGFDLAAEWAGWTNIFHCEINPFGQKTLKYYWPNAISYDDITKTDFNVHRGTIDILTGGFPCQPFSVAGKRLGTEDHRNLWPEYYRAIKEIQPTWVVGENVPGLLSWSDGLVFEQVQADLENEGYEVQPFIIPACAKNAPHRRDRVWFVAYSDCNGFNECNGNNEINASERGVNAQCDIESIHIKQPITKHTNLQRQKRRMHEVKSKTTIRKQFSERNARSVESTNWNNFPTQSPICGGDDGLPTELDGITFSKWRAESIKGYGNAIVPQVALELFKIIEKL